VAKAGRRKHLHFKADRTRILTHIPETMKKITKERILPSAAAGVLSGVLVTLGYLLHFSHPGLPSFYYGLSRLRYLLPSLIAAMLKKPRNLSPIDGLVAGLTAWGTIYYGLLFIHTNQEFIFGEVPLRKAPGFFGYHVLAWSVWGVLTALAVKSIYRIFRRAPSQVG
jgi:hypothetical protein